ncbi:nucleotide-binding protein [Marinobacter sp. chi1]|uniref:Nucleotide-binding protein n=1 Tax=Marinobacter suaedae TaxID=3057675 RepID=A0ABT8W1X3_9GAMM|nr:nucleotide-binding protein [Marinobacter sp. chi1]MDO3722242.1 nucleotide-binding protein [Marinobacter sp. chi1]
MESQIVLVEALIEEGENFDFQNFCFPHSSHPGEFAGADTPEWKTFKIRALNLVSKHLSQNSPAVALAHKGAGIRTQNNGRDKFEIVKSNFIKALQMLVETLKNDTFGELKTHNSFSNSPALSNKVFVVHGHDQGLKTDVERFLREVGLIPVVLHREADEGATIIEKFEKHSDVGFAFILLTPDEVSYTVDQIGVDESQRMTEFRARPNVIFEFGYFVAMLGRNRVCCLHKGEVVVPSDLSGLIYKKVGDSIDTQAYSIIKELKAAGFEIHM